MITKVDILRRACVVAATKAATLDREARRKVWDAIAFATPSNEERAAEQILNPRCRQIVGILAMDGYDQIHDAAQDWLRETGHAVNTSID